MAGNSHGAQREVQAESDSKDSALRDRRAFSVPSAEQSVLTTNVALQLPNGLAFDAWERAGSQLAGVLSSSCWWLGDWLIFGKHHFSDRYERAVRSAGLRYQTLRNYAWVAASFPVDRRRAALSFQHHAELASLDTVEQDRWLGEAQELGWSLHRLRHAVRESREGAPRPAPDSESVRQLSVPSERFQRWYEAAQHAGTDVDQWMMATLDSAAERLLTA
ncbi:LmbU family transcriptional regulator [Actinoplanes philippinensis]|uniref:LmbU family transcriptional regulator n=1 Tax=Actinoplanes philippinensis TaxID=35752 RepID=UPI00340121D7